MRRFFQRCVFSCLAVSLTAFAWPAWSTDTYPSRSIRIVVPFPAGQGADILTRVIAQRLAAELGQAIVVENKPGAGGIIGTAFAAKAAPDGYTLYMGSSGPLAISPNVYKSVNFDTLKDFEPISNIASVTQVLVVAPESPISSVQELIEQAKGQPGVLQFATAGNGTTNHLTMELFSQMSGISMAQVPYKGSPAAMNDLIAGRVPIMFDAIPGVLGNVKAGRLRALAVSSPERSPFLPNVPTVAESGVKDFATTGWIGLLAPAGTPPNIIQKLYNAVHKVMGDNDLKKQLNDLAFTPIGDTPAEFRAFIKKEVSMWAQVAKSANVQLD